MDSFKLKTESGRDFVFTIVGLVSAIGVFLLLDRVGMTDSATRVVALLGAAGCVSFFVSGGVGRLVGFRYPSARHKWLLSVALTFLGFFGVAQFILPGGDEGPFTLAFMVPAGACITAFLIVNRRDPEVFR